MSQTRLTEQDLLAGGCRVVRAFLPAEEVNTSACSDATAAEDGPADAQKERGLDQLQLWTAEDPEKRETLKALAAAISDDRVHSVCAEVVECQSSLKR